MNKPQKKPRYISEKIFFCEICRIEGMGYDKECPTCGGYSEKAFKALQEYAKKHSRKEPTE